MEEKQSTMYWVVGIIVLVIIVVGIAYSVRDTEDSTEETTTEAQEKPMEEKMEEGSAGKDEGFRVLAQDDANAFKDKSLNYEYEGQLKDVAGGNASGVARQNFKDGIYEMYAEFENLPEPADNEFYEGWIVRKEPFEFISTGKVEKVNGVYQNTYQSSTDLTDYNRYVLTIEPDDGDPAPAGHVVEGDMEKKS